MSHPVLRAIVSRCNVPFAVLLVIAVAVEFTAAERLWKTIPWNGSAERHCYGPPPPSPPPPPPLPPTRRRQWTTVRPRYTNCFLFFIWAHLVFRTSCFKSFWRTFPPMRAFACPAGTRGGAPRRWRIRLLLLPSSLDPTGTQNGKHACSMHMTGWAAVSWSSLVTVAVALADVSGFVPENVKEHMVTGSLNCLKVIRACAL